MIKLEGRLLVRAGHVQGLFLPVHDHTLREGIYDIRSVLGELQLEYVGLPKCGLDRFGALSVKELGDEASTLLTATEYKSAC